MNFCVLGVAWLRGCVLGVAWLRGCVCVGCVMCIFYAGGARIAGIELGIQLEISSETLMNVKWKPGDSGRRPPSPPP